MSAFALVSAPAVSTQATVTQAAAGTGVRNVCNGFSFGFSATTALGGITTVTVNLRDGTTGAGTILRSFQFTLAAAVVAPLVYGIAGLQLQGSLATAMTLEFAALATNLLQFVNLDGYTLP